jgi:hypothetical protein
MLRLSCLNYHIVTVLVIGTMSCFRIILQRMIYSYF